MEHDYQAAEDAFSSGGISTATDDELSKHLLALANKPIENDRLKHRDIIRGITINHMLLQNHIDRLNKQNNRTERWVIALAIAALISSVFQIFTPVLFPEQSTASKLQKPRA